ncbi:dTMP kinase, partial [Streptomyces sp. NPDC055815]
AAERAEAAKAAREKAARERRAAEKAAAERTAAAESAAASRASRTDGVSANDVTVATPVVRPDAPTVSPDEVTVETPIVKPEASPRPEAETTVLPQIRDARDADETAVLPPVRAADETAVLPPVRDAGPSDPVDRVPQGIFRDAPQESHGANDRTRELPQLDENGRPRRRSDWAEETPLDDLPTLADELFGPHEDEDEGPRRRR